MEKQKYITYRESRNIYQIKITVKVPDAGGKVISKQIVKQSKTLDNAILIRDGLIKLYRLDVDLLCVITAKPKKVAAIRNDDCLREIIFKWYEIKKAAIELQTQRRYNNIVSKVIIPILGNMRLSNITHDMIQKMIYTLHEKGYVDGCKKGMAVSSLRVTKTLLKQLFDFCKVYPNPAKGIQFPKETKIRREYLTDSEVKKLLGYIK